MTDDEATRFLIEIGGPAGPLGEDETVSLRQALLDHGAIAAEPAAPARFVDVVTVLAVAAAGVQTAAALADVLGFLQSWRDNRRREGRAVTVRVGGADLPAEPVTADAPVVAALLRRPGLEPRRRYALIVAINSYADNGLRALRSPAVDAEALGSALGDPDIGGYEVSVLRDVDERTVRRRVGSFFADRDPDDLLLLHFSCHGIKDRQNRLHLAATDTELRALGATSVPASFIDSQMAQTSARRVVLILDCCFSGAYARDMAARADRSVNVAEEFSHSGRVVLTASSATEYAFEGAGPAGEHDARPSVFTAALVAGLRDGTADLDGDGEISVDDWYTHAYRTVTSRGVGQAPTKSSTAVSGNFIVARSVKGAALPALIREDLDSDRVPLRLAAVEQLAGMVRRQDPTAVTARAELERVAAEDDSVRVRNAAADTLAAAPTSVPRAARGPAPAPRVASQTQPVAVAPDPVLEVAATVTGAEADAVDDAVAQAVPVMVAAQDPAVEPTAVEPAPAHEIDVPAPRAADASVAASFGESTPVLWATRIVGATAVFGAVAHLAVDPVLRMPRPPMRFYDFAGPLLLAVAGLWLAMMPRRSTQVLAVLAGLAPWIAQMPLSIALGGSRYTNDTESLATTGLLLQVIALVGVALLYARGSRPPAGRGFGTAAAAAFALAISATWFVYFVPPMAGGLAMILGGVVAYAAADRRTAKWTMAGFGAGGVSWFTVNDQAMAVVRLPATSWIMLAFLAALATAVIVAFTGPAASEEDPDTVPWAWPASAAVLLGIAVVVAVFDPAGEPDLGHAPPGMVVLCLAAIVVIAAVMVRTPVTMACVAGLLSWAPGQLLFDADAGEISPRSMIQQGLAVVALVLMVVALLRSRRQEGLRPVPALALPAVAGTLGFAFAARMIGSPESGAVSGLAAVAVLVPAVVVAWRTGERALAASLTGIAAGTTPALIWLTVAPSDYFGPYEYAGLLLSVVAATAISVFARHRTASAH